MSKPHQGDTFKCVSCGMEIEVKTPCDCDSGDPIFACCGTSMKRMPGIGGATPVSTKPAAMK